ncbi:Asp-tRNA(Asn)/Glu-tRNA(Gln) amidotransferase GatCAB subunit A [Candidatus Poribacteria bacterium]|nr:MAG: Asp-tRNA(Asn)/Glu-tRNA(Gln) amidotransferase GatCAB subunit A [Candidatus Poribacteria bacterium]
MAETPLHFRTITEISEAIASKQLSPVEITTAMLQRINELDGRLKSYATVMADSAMNAARKAEREIESGTYRGPLHGVPIAVKDLCFTKGVRTMGAAKVLADHVPAFDGTVITKLEAAGVVLLGKLNLTEGAMGGYNPEFDIPKNPWNPDRWTGSSSSGSGVATAAGLCFGSLGSDTGGSIRFPSAACGLVGIKPTWGRVSRYGVLALAESMDHVGPMTRSVADAGIMLEAIAGFDPNDPTSLPNPVPNMLEGVERDIRGIRIGFDENYATNNIDTELAEAVRAGVEVLANQGAELVEVQVPDVDEYVSAWPTLCSTEAVLAHAATYPSRRDDYGPWFQGWLDMGAEVTGAGYAKANNLRAACTGHFRRVFADIDILVCPSMSAPPHRVSPEMLYGRYDARDPKFQRFTVPFNYNGAPTLSVPCGMNSEGLPLSIQFVGKHLSEPLLCQVGHAYESATPWHDLHPDV